MKYYKKAIEIDPEYVCAYTNCGNALQNLGLYEDSIKYYEKAIELDPEDTRSLHQLAAALFYGMKDVSSSEKLALKAIELDSEFPVALALMGSIKNIQQNPKEAKVYWKKATLIQLQRLKEKESLFESSALKKIGVLGEGTFGKVWLEQDGAVKEFLHNSIAQDSVKIQNEILSLMYSIWRCLIL
jgi:tetratricopeptide (TPR) repeat protein